MGDRVTRCCVVVDSSSVIRSESCQGSSLIVTVVLFAVAGVLAFMGKRKFAQVNFVPSESVQQIKADVEAIKADFARVRSRNESD